MNRQEEIKDFAESITNFFLVFDGLFLMNENAEELLQETKSSLEEKVLHNEALLPVIISMGGNYDSDIDCAKIEEIEALQGSLDALKDKGVKAFGSVGNAAKGAGKKTKDAADEAKKALEETKKQYETVIKWITKQYDKKIKSSKLHPDYWLVHDDIITDYLNVRSQAGQVLADQEALDKRKKVIEERERQIQHYQYINNSNESLNRQLREKLNSLDWQLKKEKEQAYEQALIDASRALGKSVTVIKSAIELFSHDEMEEEYEY